jgi:hypothetical protein
MRTVAPPPFYPPGMSYVDEEARLERAEAFRARLAAARDARDAEVAAVPPVSAAPWRCRSKVKPCPRAAGRWHRRRAG